MINPETERVLNNLKALGINIPREQFEQNVEAQKYLAASLVGKDEFKIIDAQLNKEKKEVYESLAEYARLKALLPTLNGREDLKEAVESQMQSIKTKLNLALEDAQYEALDDADLETLSLETLPAYKKAIFEEEDVFQSKPESKSKTEPEKRKSNMEEEELNNRIANSAAYSTTIGTLMRAQEYEFERLTGNKPTLEQMEAANNAAILSLRNGGGKDSALKAIKDSLEIDKLQKERADKNRSEEIEAAKKEGYQQALKENKLAPRPIGLQEKSEILFRKKEEVKEGEKEKLPYQFRRPKGTTGRNARVSIAVEKFYEKES